MQLNEIELWLDMQLSPSIARWIEEELFIKAVSSYDMFINNEKDEIIFLAAKQKANVILLSKDSDFPLLIERLSHPPKLVWLRMGNCPNSVMKFILKNTLTHAVNDLLQTETIIVEINNNIQ